MWEAVANECEGKTLLYQVDMRRQLQEMKCSEGEDIKAHLSEMWRRREGLAGMGAVIKDEDFTAMMVGSLPESFRPLLSSLLVMAQATKTSLDSHDFKQYPLEQAES